MKTEKHCKIHAQSASPYCVECYKDDLAKEQADDRLARTTCYRLLDHNDTIRADDEFLEDDCITWTLIGIQHRWNVGCYWHTALKPMRRILGDNAGALPPGTPERSTNG